jgi:DNA-binding CsgD family transcriptional regulator
VHRDLLRAQLALGRGDDARALELLEHVRRRIEGSLEPQYHGPLAALLAEAHRRRGRYDEAREAVRTGLERLGAGAARPADPVRVAAVALAGLAVEADCAERARDRDRPGELRAAITAADRLLAAARDAASSERPAAVAALAAAGAEHARAAGGVDPDAWSDAAYAWDALDRPYLAALARHSEAQARVLAGDRAGAEEAAAKAMRTARELGATWLEAQLAGLARRARLRLPEADDAGAETAAEPDALDGAEALGLTPREAEVLALLVQGRTNREIGARLYMAEKTASVHVSRILAKLGVRTRTEAAAVAHRLNLAGNGAP